MFFSLFSYGAERALTPFINPAYNVQPLLKKINNRTCASAKPCYFLFSYGAERALTPFIFAHNKHLYHAYVGSVCPKCVGVVGPQNGSIREQIDSF
jgi:hypothetical protein